MNASTSIREGVRLVPRHVYQLGTSFSMHRSRQFRVLLMYGMESEGFWVAVSPTAPQSCWFEPMPFQRGP